jgi:hypothetical protein
VCWILAVCCHEKSNKKWKFIYQKQVCIELTCSRISSGLSDLSHLATSHNQGRLHSPVKTKETISLPKISTILTKRLVTQTTPEDYVFKITLGLVLSSYYYSISPQRPVGIWPMKTLDSVSYKGKVRSHNSKLRWMKYHIAICLGWDTPTKCCIFRTEKWIQLPWWWWWWWCRWVETTYLIYGHQRAYSSSSRWYMSTENHGGMISTPDSSTRPLLQSYQQSRTSKAGETGSENYEFYLTKYLFRTSKGSLTCRKI